MQQPQRAGGRPSWRRLSRVTRSSSHRRSRSALMRELPAGLCSASSLPDTSGAAAGCLESSSGGFERCRAGAARLLTVQQRATPTPVRSGIHRQIFLISKTHRGPPASHCFYRRPPLPHDISVELAPAPPKAFECGSARLRCVALRNSISFSGRTQATRASSVILRSLAVAPEKPGTGNCAEQTPGCHHSCRHSYH